MLLYILILIMIGLLIFLYAFFKKDIAQPAILFLFSYILSVFCCILNIERWNVNFKLNTFSIFLLGTLEFIGICVLIHGCFNKVSKTLKENEEKEKNNMQRNDNDTSIKKIPTYIVILSIVYCIITLIMRFAIVLKVANMFGDFSNFSEALTLFKANTSYAKNYEMPHYYNLISKPIIILAYIFLYYFIKRIVYSKEKIIKKILINSYYLIPTFTYIIFEFISSNRLSIISVIIAAIIEFLIIYQEKNRKVVAKKKIFILACIGIIGLLIFYFSASLIGRKNNNNFFRYITLYCGGSIDCFNIYLQDNKLEKSKVWGEETFYYLIDNMNHYLHKNIKIPKVIHLEFRYNNKIMIGNVYTAYRRWHYDFGILGIVILNGIMAATYQIFYEVIKNKISKNKNMDLLLIIYGYIAFPLLLHPIDSYFTLLTCRLTFITTLILFYIVYYFIKNTDVTFENKKLKIIYKNKKIF